MRQMAVVLSNGTDQQPDPDGGHRYRASSLERRCPAGAPQSGAYHRKASEHQDRRRSHVGQDQQGACSHSGNEPCRMPEVIRDQSYLAVPWHERVHEAEQRRDSQRGKDG